MAKKTCPICGHEKPMDGFYKAIGVIDGRSRRCKECVKGYQKKLRADNPELFSEYERRRYQDPKRRADIDASVARHKIRHPDRYKARTAVGNAVRDGRLIKTPCEMCGAEKVQGHHEDYSRPLDVRWLCFRCHREHGHGQVVVRG